MKTFSIGQLDIDIVRHVRVDGSRFPTPDPGSLGDYFIVDARWQGNSIDFYPNEGRRVDPLAFGFIGRKVVPVHANTGTEEEPAWTQVGTKRGGDFRSRFFRTVARRLAKAVVARQLNKRVGEVTDADLRAASVAIRRLAAGTFADPVDLKTFALDDACRHLRDAAGDLEEGEKPPGTVATIDVGFDSYATDPSSGADTETEDGTTLTVGLGEFFGTTFVNRVQLRFPLSSITAGSTVNDSDLQFNVTSANANNIEDAVHAYNNTGDDDPDPDTPTTKLSRSIAGTALVAGSSLFTSTGSKSVDLGTTADGQIEGNINSPAIYSLGLKGRETGVVSVQSLIEAIENAGSDPATLTVDYTAAGGATYPGWYGQKGGWW